MSKKLTADDGRQSLNAHVAAKGENLKRNTARTSVGRNSLASLEDRAFVRYPCEIVFDAAPLQAGECALPVPNGRCPEHGFTMFVHPFFALQPREVSDLVLSQLVLVNYGEFASPEDAEAFGAAAVGLSIDAYYHTLCALADELG